MSVTGNWGTVWNGLVTLTNTGKTVTGWTISFNLASNITAIWDGAIVSHVGSTYTVTNVSWDATIAAGRPVTFGFNAAGALPALPSSFVFNGGTTTPVSLPTLGISGGSITATPLGGDEVFTLTLSAASSSAVTVNYATQDGTALAGTDYTATTGTAIIAAGQTSASVRVATRPGRTGTSTFSMVLSGVIGATLANTSATGSIINTPSLSVSGIIVNEGSVGSHNAVFAIMLSGPAPAPVSVAYSTVAGTAVAGIDYVATSGTVTIPTGASSANVTVATSPGTPGTHTFQLALSNPTGAAIANGTATATLITPTPAPTPSPTPAPTSIPSLQLANITVDLTPPQGGSAGSALKGGYLHTNGNQIVDATGENVRINAVNWFGMETSLMAPFGLDVQSYSAIMDRMVQTGFNTLRLPFSNKFLHNPIISTHINTTLNPDLAGLSGLGLMDKIVDYAGQIGLKIILDDHTSSDTGGGANPNGLWYDSTYTDAGFTADWKMLAQHYAGNSTIIGADLMNEPHSIVTNGVISGATWGDGSATDWAAAATRAGNAIQAENPNWLIIVEGIQYYNNTWTNWGGNLQGVAARPVVLSIANQLVYSAHDYPASVATAPWLSDPNFPNNLPAVWTANWGYIAQQNIAPIFIGEHGANLANAADRAWASALNTYLSTQGGNPLSAGQQGVSSGYWDWNAAPGTNLIGLIQPDYATLNTALVADAQQYAYHTTATTMELDFSVALAAPSTTPVKIVYSTANGTARDGIDFVGTSGTLAFSPGETAKIVPVMLLNPGTTGNLTFLLNLSTVSGQALGSESATIVHDPIATVTRTSQQWSTVAYNIVTITNTGTSTINGWEVKVDTASKVITNNVYDSQLTSHSDTSYIFTSAAWNQIIEPGKSVNFEFGATQTSINTPVMVSLIHTGQ